MYQLLSDCFIRHPVVPPIAADKRAAQWGQDRGGVVSDFYNVNFAADPRGNFAVSSILFHDPARCPDGSEAQNLSGLRAIEVLRWDGLKHADTAMETIGTLDSLMQLEMSQSDLTTIGLQHLIPFSRLSLLDLAGTGLTDAAVSSLSQLPRGWHSLDRAKSNEKLQPRLRKLRQQQSGESLQCGGANIFSNKVLGI